MASASYGDRVEGLHAVRAALAAGRVTSLKIEKSRLEEFGHLGVPVEVVDDVRSHAVGTAPQGVVAICRPLTYRSVGEIVAEENPAALVVVDHIEDPHNLGAIARSAAAAGIPRLIVAGRRSAPLGATAFKAAAGAFERISVGTVSSVADLVAQLKRMDVWTVGLDANANDSLFGLPLLAEPVALVIGSEGGGISHLVGQRLDTVVRIPMSAGFDSLNASVAAAIACYEVGRVRRPT